MYGQNQVNQKLAASSFDACRPKTASECGAVAQGATGVAGVTLPPAADAAGRIDGQLSMLQSAIDRLVHKIAPVMLPAAPEQSKESGRPAAAAPILEVFAQISDRLKQMERQVEGAYDRLVV